MSALSSFWYLKMRVQFIEVQTTVANVHLSKKKESDVDVRVMQGRTTLQAGQKKRKEDSVRLKIKGVMSVGKKKTLCPFFHFLLPWTIKCRSAHLSPLFVSDTDRVATQIVTLSVCCEVPVISPLLVYSAGPPPTPNRTFSPRAHTKRTRRENGVWNAERAEWRGDTADEKPLQNSTRARSARGGREVQLFHFKDISAPSRLWCR